MEVVRGTSKKTKIWWFLKGIAIYVQLLLLFPLQNESVICGSHRHAVLWDLCVKCLKRCVLEEFVGSCLWEHWEDISMFYLYCSAPFAATHYSSSHSSEGVYCITNFLFGTRLYADMNLTVWNKVSIEILKMHFSLSEVAGVVGFMEVGVELISSFHQNDKSTGI